MKTEVTIKITLEDLPGSVQVRVSTEEVERPSSNYAVAWMRTSSHASLLEVLSTTLRMAAIDVINTFEAELGEFDMKGYQVVR